MFDAREREKQQKGGVIINRIVLIGNLAADPESRTTQSGVAQCTLRLAVTRRFADKQTGQREADFFSVICWRQTAEFASRYLSKGRKIAVEGSLQTRSYDAQDGSKRYVTEILADNIEFCDSKQEGAQKLSAAAGETVRQAEAAFGHGMVEVNDDELPF